MRKGEREREISDGQKKRNKGIKEREKRRETTICIKSSLLKGICSSQMWELYFHNHYMFHIETKGSFPFIVKKLMQMNQKQFLFLLGNDLKLEF